jgi:hypothetical protein
MRLCIECGVDLASDDDGLCDGCGSYEALHRDDEHDVPEEVLE